MNSVNMDDAILGRIERHIDGWLGQIPFESQCSASKTLRFRIRANEEGPTTKQKQLVEALMLRYEKLWQKISEKLAELRTSTTNHLPKSRVLLSVPGVIIGHDGKEVYDFILGYEFEDEQDVVYDFCFSDWELRYAYKAT